MTSARTRGGEPGIGLQYRSVPTCRVQEFPRLGPDSARRRVLIRQVQPDEETIESAARENARVKTPIGERSVARAATRQPKRAWITGGHLGGEAEYTSGERELRIFF